MNYFESKAEWFAGYWHGSIDQRRKYTNEPYINHPRSVVGILKNYVRDDSMICAAWMHDLVEDTPCTIDLIAREFDYKIAKLVEELTDTSKLSDGNRAVRKEIERLRLSNVSAEAKTIKLCDLIDNTSTIVEYDPNFAKVYLKEKESLLTVLVHGNNELWKLAHATLASAKGKLGLI